MKAEISKYLKSADIMMVGSDEGGNFAYDYRLDGLHGVLSRALGTKSADALMSGLPEQMAVFHFPFGERDNVVAHGAFFHEVGHQIDIGILGLSERVTKTFLDEVDAEIREVVAALVKTLPGLEAEGAREGSELIVEDLVKSVQGALWNWAREFCADSLATRILGPAYAVITVVSPALLSSLEVHAPTHPATLLRLRGVLELLGSTKSGDFLSLCRESLQEAGVLELLDGWKARCDASAVALIKWQGSVHPLANKELHSATARWGERLAAAVVQKVAFETSGQNYYSPETYRGDIRDVLPTLKAWITINERIDYTTRTHRVNEIATIYNVGVARFLEETRAEGRARLSNLLRKSIELSQIHRAILSPASP
jgi:hypothetical protein